MRLSIGSYNFQTDSVFISTESKVRWTSNRIPIMIDSEIGVRGELLPTNGLTDALAQANLTTLENDLRNALKVRNFDLIFYRNDGQPTSIAVRSQDTISGVNLMSGPDFPGDTPGEYAVQRAFRFRVAFSVEFDSSNDNFPVDFTEKMAFSGGGPIYKFKRAVEAPAQKQRIHKLTEYTLMQSGEITGYRDYILPPRAAYPGNLVESPNIQYLGSERIGDVNRNYKISYSYLMQSSTVMQATPSLWPV